jgi:hypothetical protein
MDEVAEANKKKKEFKPFPTRIKGAVENWWYTIQTQVGKFCGFHAQVQRRMRSGSNNNDIVSWLLNHCVLPDCW